MDKIRVLHILDELNTGGAERIVYSYFQHIDRDRFQWDFVITRNSDPSHKGILEDKIESMGGHIYHVHRKRENYLKNIEDVNRIITNGNYNIVHSHLDELSAIYLLSAKRHGVSVRICHSHLAGTDRGFAVELLCKFLRPIMRHATTDKFACGKDAGVALWGKNAVAKGQVHFMKNAINTNEFRFSDTIRNAKRDEFGINSDTLVIGSVGRLSYQKNSVFLVDIFSEYHKLVTNSILLMVGVGDLWDEVNERIDLYNLRDSIKLLGSRDDVNEIMMAMDIFLLPSRFEGLPIVMVEAQCTGLPCFVSDTVTKEINLSSEVINLSINDSALFWAKAIEKKSLCNDRNMGDSLVQENGYEIVSASKDLEDYYIKRSEELFHGK